MLASLKFNLRQAPEARNFRIVGAGNGSSRITWEGTSPFSADQLLDQPKLSKLDQAVGFLQETLAHGPLPTSEVEDRANAAGIAIRTLDRARGRIGIEIQRETFGGQVLLGLPSSPSDSVSTSGKRELALTDVPFPYSNGPKPIPAADTDGDAVSANTTIRHRHDGQVYREEDREERAAIAQFDGGLPLPEAERLAGLVRSVLGEEAA